MNKTIYHLMSILWEFYWEIQKCEKEDGSIDCKKYLTEKYARFILDLYPIKTNRK